MRTAILYILLSCFRSAICVEPTIALFNEIGKDAPPKDLKQDASWIGLALLTEGTHSQACTATHLDPSHVVTHTDCLPRTEKAALALHFWDKKGKRRSVRITAGQLPSDVGQSVPPSAIKVLNISPTQMNDWANDWSVAGNIGRENELWFGGFHPQWELVRVYSMEEGKPEKQQQHRYQYHFQVNTCKAARKSPILKTVRPAKLDEDEESIREQAVIPNDSPFKNFPVIEKCHRPLSRSSRGAIIVLAKDFNQKYGFLVENQFEGLGMREIANLNSSPRFQDGSLLRYIGADGLETNVPRDPATVSILQSFSFDLLFPNKKNSGF